MNDDTINLLKECSAGIKMGAATLEDVIPHIKSEKLKQSLESCRETHKKLEHEMQTMLENHNLKDQEPNTLASTMSWMKTHMKLTFDESDKSLADLLTDGCNMGVKSLTKYLNEYENAESETKDFAKRLINSEEKMIEILKEYL